MPQKVIIIDDIGFGLSAASLHAKSASDHSDFSPMLVDLVEEARLIARPRAAYLASMIDERGENHLVIDGVWIQSRVLRVNFDRTHRVFPFVATCGHEIEEWANSQFDELRRFWAMRICELALGAATGALANHIEAHFHTGPTSKVNPGSTIDWPLKGQRELFQLLGDASERIGVSLAEDLWMVPSMSTSGIRYPSKEAFENCSMCPMEDCRLRKAPYEEGLYERKYLME